MTKTITEQIEELEKEIARLKNLEKLLDKAVKDRLGLGIKEIEKVLKKGGKASRFEQGICQYFDLITETDKENFCHIICSEATLNYYHKKLADLEENWNENATG